MAFKGFTTEALGFLARLPERDTSWFRAHGKEYESLVSAPTKAFVAELGVALTALRPGLVAIPKTNGSIAPMHNDLRFSPDKPPYKDHLLLRFWEGEPKRSAPTLYVRLTSDEVGFATGLLPADLSLWRQRVSGRAGARLGEAVDRLAKTKRADVVGQELKRVPAPYPQDHPQGDLLRHKMLQVRWPEPIPKAVHSPAFVDWCAKRLASCLPVHEILVEDFS